MKRSIPYPKFYLYLNFRPNAPYHRVIGAILSLHQVSTSIRLIPSYKRYIVQANFMTDKDRGAFIEKMGESSTNPANLPGYKNGFNISIFPDYTPKRAGAIKSEYAFYCWLSGDGIKKKKG